MVLVAEDVTVVVEVPTLDEEELELSVVLLLLEETVVVMVEVTVEVDVLVLDEEVVEDSVVLLVLSDVEDVEVLMVLELVVEDVDVVVAGGRLNITLEALPSLVSTESAVLLR